MAVIKAKAPTEVQTKQIPQALAWLNESINRLEGSLGQLHNHMEGLMSRNDPAPVPTSDGGSPDFDPRPSFVIALAELGVRIDNATQHVKYLDEHLEL